MERFEPEHHHRLYQLDGIQSVEISISNLISGGVAVFAGMGFVVGLSGWKNWIAMECSVAKELALPRELVIRKNGERVHIIG
ncbi:MAG: hypothetical protein WCS94_22790 [Verrucomicrobiota bacterium]